jgi:tRNA A-37 threonylcarbamoyl transferase component Bud32
MEQAKVPERYKLIEEVGQGGMAIVYRAQDETLKRVVAIKVLHQHLAAEPESKARLEREAQAVAKLRHDNILEIFDYSGLDSESSYIVTEFIDGQTLKQFLSGRTLRFPEVAALISVEVCGALAHAHGVGVLHRDVKPENVMVRKDGLLKLMDFGIAQVLDLERMTVTGQLLGSPAYMAPEIIEGKQLDFRTDVFSVGIMLYLLATGSLPFTGKNPHEVLRRITEGKFPDPRLVGRGVDQALSRIITRALARRPEDRYADVGPLADDLHAYLDDAGLGEVRGELRTFFADPAAYEAALPKRLASALMAAAGRHLSAKRSAKALELWNRVLAFDPKNAAVLAALHRMEGRARLKMAVAVVGIAAIVGGGAATIVKKLAERRRETALTVAARGTPPAAPVPVAAAPAGAVASPAISAPPAAVAPPGNSTVAAPAPAKRAAVQRRAPRPAPAPVAAPAPTEPVPARTFTLGPTPQNVDVYLDGQRQFGYDVDHTKVSVPWAGAHTIEFRSPSNCCFPERVSVGPELPIPADSIIARRLKWRPAHLVVTTEPAGATARVLVRDLNRGGSVTAARPGEEIDIPFFPDDDSSKEVEISADDGDAFATERVRIRAGQRLKHLVKMRTGSN